MAGDGPKHRAAHDGATPSRLTAIRQGSLADLVYERIVDGIAQQRWGPGERIYEEHLALELDVSRVPVRAAMNSLERHGILTSRPHRGRFVMEINPRKIRQAFRLRLDLELHACPDTVRAVADDPAKIEPLDAILAEMTSARDASDPARFNAADLAFHCWHVETSGNDMLCILWGAMSAHLRIYFALADQAGVDPDTRLNEHFELRRFIIERDIDGAMNLLRCHIDRGFPDEAGR